MLENNLTLLYVEDEKHILDGYAKFFRTYFANVLLARTYQEALDHYYNNHVDVAVLDISIEGSNGLNLAKEFRLTNSHIELVILSAYTDNDMLLNALNANVFTYLVKPVRKREITSTLDKLLDKVQRKKALTLCGNYSFNIDSGILYNKNDKVKISKREIKLLQYLSTHKDQHHTSHEIASALFNKDENSEDDSSNNVVQIISRFKKKMLDLYEKEDFFIDNIYGLGYKIAV